jgi:hypothetical protein
VFYASPFLSKETLLYFEEIKIGGFMKLNRSVVSVSKMAKSNTEEVAQISKKDALLYVWDVTQEVYSFTGGFDAESRLQRDVVSLTRKQC